MKALATLWAQGVPVKKIADDLHVSPSRMRELIRQGVRELTGRRIRIDSYGLQEARMAILFHAAARIADRRFREKHAEVIRDVERACYDSLTTRIRRVLKVVEIDLGDVS
jgi:Mn-dependent DtxR family transcriptional regulator